MKYLFVFLSIIICHIVIASDNAQQQRADSIKAVLSYKSIPFLERYDLLIREYRNFPLPIMLGLSQTLLPEAKKFPDPDKKYELYVRHIMTLGYFNGPNKQYDKLKLQVDTAFTLIDQTNHHQLVAQFYQIMGLYYLNTGNFALGHEYWYKMIDYCKQFDDTKIEVGDVYMRIADYYYGISDYVELRKIAEAVSTVATDYKFPKDSVNTCILWAAYYRSLLEKEVDPTANYNDSCIYYQRKCLRLYDSLAKPSDNMVSLMYYACTNLAVSLTKRNRSGDLEEALAVLEKGFKKV